MSKSKSRRRRRKNRAMFVTILTFALLGTVLILIIVILSQSASGSKTAPAMSTLENRLPTEAPVNTFTENTTPVPVVTAEPTIAPTIAPTPTPEPTPAPEPFEYLPVVEHGPTDRKRIAITVDDCFQLDNLKTILSCAYQNGAKLTLFPIGENIVRDGMSDILKASVQMGYEIENHTYSHARIFRMSEE